jgi:hypothetical protein
MGLVGVLGIELPALVPFVACGTFVAGSRRIAHDWIYLFIFLWNGVFGYISKKCGGALGGL